MKKVHVNVGTIGHIDHGKTNGRVKKGELGHWICSVCGESENRSACRVRTS